MGIYTTYGIDDVYQHTRVLSKKKHTRLIFEKEINASSFRNGVSTTCQKKNQCKHNNVKVTICHSARPIAANWVKIRLQSMGCAHLDSLVEKAFFPRLLGIGRLD